MNEWVDVLLIAEQFFSSFFDFYFCFYFLLFFSFSLGISSYIAWFLCIFASLISVVFNEHQKNIKTKYVKMIHFGGSVSFILPMLSTAKHNNKKNKRAKWKEKLKTKSLSSKAIKLTRFSLNIIDNLRNVNVKSCQKFQRWENVPNQTLPIEGGRCVCICLRSSRKKNIILECNSTCKHETHSGKRNYLCLAIWKSLKPHFQLNCAFLSIFTVFPFYFFFFAVPVVAMEALIGETVYLPCNVSTHDVNDDVVLVLWYRADKGTPIYR